MPASPFIVASPSAKSSVNLGSIANLREYNFWQHDNQIGQATGLSPAQAFGRVPWLYRAVTLRSNSVGDVPWGIFKGKTEVLNSEDDERQPPAELAWIRPPLLKNADPTRPTLGDLLRLIELDLCLCGEAYWLTDRNRAKIASYRRAIPNTIQLDTDPKVGLKGFKRTIPGAGEPLAIALGEMPFWWLPNPNAELGPGPAPGAVALYAAGLIASIDDFGRGFFERGAINTTVLSVEGNPADAELRKLENWWKRLLGGNRRAHETVAVKSIIKPIVVGQPPKDLALPELTEAKRADVATALGVPMSVLDDRSSNFASAQQSEWNFWTLTILPECELLETGLNRQVFGPLGYEFRFQPEKLEVFEAREAKKSFELLALVQGGVMKPNELREKMAMEPVAEGDKLLKPQSRTDVQSNSELSQETAQRNGAAAPVPQQQQRKALELAQWQRKALKNLKLTGSAEVPFKFDAWTPEDTDHVEAIERALETATTPEEVKAAFSAAPFRGLSYP